MACVVCTICDYSAFEAVAVGRVNESVLFCHSQRPVCASVSLCLCITVVVSQNKLYIQLLW